MSIVDLCIYFVIGLVSVAYPILLQVIATLDEKYASIVIVELFKKEKEYRCFRILLVACLCLIGIYALSNLSLTLNELPGLLRGVAYALLLATALLVTTFLLFISKILTYYTPARIVTYFISKKADQKYLYFNALGDILFFAIDKKQDGIARLIHEYYYKAFAAHRKAHPNEPVVYPDAYYTLVYNIVSRLAPVKNAAFTFLEHRTVGGIWLIGELKDVEISEATYTWLWRLLTVAVRFERDDMVMLFWANAHQHLIYHLQRVTADYENRDGQPHIKNAAAVARRDAERERLLEFTHALGGMLLFRNRLECIRRTFRYTSSTPPSYDLLPVHMTQVFQRYFQFLDPYQERFPFITTRYWFPDTEGIGSEDLVKIWACKYAALLLLRQYSIVKYYVYIEPLQLPQLPQKKTERRIWIDRLDHFKALVEAAYADTTLLEQTGLGFLNDTWLRLQKKTGPADLIEQVKQAVTRAYERTEAEQELSNAEVDKLKEATIRIIDHAYRPYGQLFSNPIRRNFEGFQAMGIRTLFDKSAFADDQEADYGNHHTILAESAADNIAELVAGNFFIRVNQLYHVSEDDLFPAVDRLAPDPAQYVLINIGYDLEFWISAGKIPGLTATGYHGIPLYTLPGRMPERRLYIVRRSELPYLFSRKPAASEVKKHGLQPIGDHDLYFSIIDLYRHPGLRAEWLKTGELTPDELDKKVQIYIVSNAILRWRKGTGLIALNIAYPYMPGHNELTPLNEIPAIDA